VYKLRTKEVAGELASAFIF